MTTLIRCGLLSPSWLFLEAFYGNFFHQIFLQKLSQAILLITDFLNQLCYFYPRYSGGLNTNVSMFCIGMVQILNGPFQYHRLCAGTDHLKTSHSKTEPFTNGTALDHPKSKCVWYSSPHCMFNLVQDGHC